MPSRRLFLLAACVTLLAVGGVLVAGLTAAALVADGLLAMAFGLDWLRARRTPLEGARRWPPLLFQGTSAELEVRLVVPVGSRRRPGREVVLELREALAPGFADAPRRRRFRIAPGTGERWVLPLVPRRRGEHEAGPAMARVLGPWGLAWSQRCLIEPERRRVYPRVRWEGRVGRLLTLAHRQRLGQALFRHRGEGSEPYALREYLPGDPLTRIHWRATARHGRLVSREDTWERGARLVILLDCARAMASQAGEVSKLDHALAAALALARVAAARGDAVALLAFSSRVECSARLRSGSRGLARAYAAFYDLEARLVEPAYDAAVEKVFEMERRSATVVLMTSVVDLAAAELLRESLLRLEGRHRPLLVHLEDPEIGRLAQEPPATVAGAFAQVSALEILLANRRLTTRLRHAGVRAVTTPADRLALETLEAYLALFRQRGRGRGRGGRAGALQY